MMSPLLDPAVNCLTISIPDVELKIIISEAESDDPSEIVSAPPAPVIVSAPPAPEIISFPEPVVIISFPAAPVIDKPSV